ncbi:hypothetical protein G6L26_009700 [Agrobacterium radiobacter]|uniref:hypothetical protein n=1 Tax=Agrobacterium tumefaciens complex TaxID=1183400 RepID=UPI0013014ED1|nr:hypothetical protein [Agrobacterium tumefaciens]NTA05459.1 hypothetical protein [Agrobacterium tumefaciens]NTA92052.1 hypothetical protein [Agrobacterium tumefaciens]
MDQPIYQRIVTESHLDAECQKFVEREFPKAVRAVNRFSGKANPPAAVKSAEGRPDGR